jgi:isopenicillin-N epimerase
MEKYNWADVSKKCHELVLSNAQRFFNLLGATPISPLTSEWIGQMISIPIKTAEPEILQRTLFTEYQIEVPIMRQGNDVYLRYSINGFNSQSDMDQLYQVVAELQQQGRL